MAGETKRQALGASLCMCVRYVGVEKREREKQRGKNDRQWADWLSVPLTGETEWRKVKDDYASKKGK